MIDMHLSKSRQRLLLERTQDRKLDAIVVGLRWHVYYLAGYLQRWMHEAAVILFADGRTWLATPNAPAKDVTADEVVAFEANWYGTLRSDQVNALAELAADELRTRGAKRIGIDTSAVTAQVALRAVGSGAHVETIDETLWQLRRGKHADELQHMRVAYDAVEAMYKRAKEIIEPGVEETYVFAKLHEAAVLSTGEPMTAYLGNDYACGTGGGPPRKGRKAKDGEIYILDLGPTFRGYFSDASRAFVVNRKPTDAQHKAWEQIVSVFPIVESMAKPGVRCLDIYKAVDDHLKLVRGNGMPHHLGHGVGLQAHEYPHLNPKWDDTLQEGEVFTAEPGLYGPELAGGIRIENAYLVTKSGVERMFEFPMELV